MSKAIRTASILHNESCNRDSGNYGLRVKLNLRKMADGAYEWCINENDETTCVSGTTVKDACNAARRAWNQSHVWDFRATWI